MSFQGPLRPYSNTVLSWLSSYEQVDTRYPILVLHGASRLGKTELAKHIKGAAATLVVDCEGALYPDLRAFDPKKHQAVICDEICGPSFVLGNKKVLQQHVDGARLGQSPTQRDAYEVFLWRTPVMVTTNHWDTHALTQQDAEWLLKNCFVEKVLNPVWASA